MVVDEYLRTANPKVWAVGDCIGGLQLAHLASAEGGRAVENALTGDAWSRWTAPSFRAASTPTPRSRPSASTPTPRRRPGYEVKLGQARFVGSGKALGEGEPDGYAQLVMDPSTGLLLGATIMGVHAVEMIHEVGVAIAEGLTRRRARRDHPRAPDGERDGDGRRAAGGRRRPLPQLAGVPETWRRLGPAELAPRYAVARPVGLLRAHAGGRPRR